MCRSARQVSNPLVFEEAFGEHEGGLLGDHEGGQVGRVGGQGHQTEEGPDQADDLAARRLRNKPHQRHAQQNPHCVPENLLNLKMY